MLYLDAPYYYINGISVFRDHVNPLQYYYALAQPRLRTTTDPATGKEVPRIQLIKYRSLVAGKGGFLTFDVHLGLTDAEVDNLASEIRRLGRLPRQPSVAPIQPLDGSVRLLIMGKESVTAAPPPRPGQPAAQPEAPRFVLKATHFAKPALFGDNGASFSVELDAEGTAIMEAALQGEITPMVVVYSVDFAGLRPAFSVRLKIDWDRVQTAMDETFGHESFFTTTEINNAVDKLVESQVITMEADNFVPDVGDAGKSVAARFEDARTRVQEMITDGFFEASLPPMKERPDGWDKAIDTISQFGRQAAMMGATGGIGGFIGTFSYKKTNYTRIDKRKLDVEFSERSAVVRTIYPQGTISGLFTALKDGIDPARFILEVDADDPFFAERRIRVINRGEMARDQLASIQAVLDYGGQVRTVVLEETGKDETVKWSSLMENGAMARPVSADLTVRFKPDAGGERPLVVTARKQVLTGDVFEVQPAEFYSRVTIPIVASPSYPWDKYPQAQVMLRYEDAAKGIRTDDTVIVKKDTANPAWSFVALDKGKRDFSYRVLHQAANHKDEDSGWLPSSGDLVDIRDPFGSLRLAVDVVPVVPRWEDVEQVFVDLSYSDPSNGIEQAESLTFTQDDHAPKKFVIDRKDRAIKLVSFKVTTVMLGGMVMEVPESFTESPRILVRPDMKGHRIITVTPPPDFVRPKLAKIEVELSYTDELDGTDIADMAVFEAPGGRKTFEFDYMDATRDAYTWRAKFLFKNGMTKRTDWARSDAAHLSIPAP